MQNRGSFELGMGPILYHRLCQQQVWVYRWGWVAAQLVFDRVLKIEIGVFLTTKGLAMASNFNHSSKLIFAQI